MAEDTQNKLGVFAPLERTTKGTTLCTATDVSVTNDTGVGERNLAEYIFENDIVVDQKITWTNQLPDPNSAILSLVVGSRYMVKGDVYEIVQRNSTEHVIEWVNGETDLGANHGSFVGFAISGLGTVPPAGTQVFNPIIESGTANHAVGAAGWERPHTDTPMHPRRVYVYIPKGHYETSKGSDIADGDKVTWITAGVRQDNNESDEAIFTLEWAGEGTTLTIFDRLAGGNEQYLRFEVEAHDDVADHEFQILKNLNGSDVSNLFYRGDREDVGASTRLYTFVEDHKGWQRDDPVLAQENREDIVALQNDLETANSEIDANELEIASLETENTGLKEQIATLSTTIAELNSENFGSIYEDAIEINGLPSPINGDNFADIDRLIGDIPQDHQLVNSIVHRIANSQAAILKMKFNITGEIAKLRGAVTTSGSIQSIRVSLIRKRGGSRKTLKTLAHLTSSLADWNNLLCPGGSCMASGTYVNAPFLAHSVDTTFNFANEELMVSDKLDIQVEFNLINGDAGATLTFARNASDVVFSMDAV